MRMRDVLTFITVKRAPPSPYIIVTMDVNNQVASVSLF